MKALIQIFVALLLTLNNGRGKTGVIPSLAFSYDANGNMILGDVAHRSASSHFYHVGCANNRRKPPFSAQSGLFQAVDLG